MSNIRREVVELFMLELGRQERLSNAASPTFESVVVDRELVREAAAELVKCHNAAEVVTELAEFAAWALTWSLHEFEQEPIGPVQRLSGDYVYGDEEDL